MSDPLVAVVKPTRKGPGPNASGHSLELLLDRGRVRIKSHRSGLGSRWKGQKCGSKKYQVRFSFHALSAISFGAVTNASMRSGEIEPRGVRPGMHRRIVLVPVHRRDTAIWGTCRD